VSTSCWLLRDGKVLAAAEVADSFGSKRRQLGQGNFEGALLVRRSRAAHTFGMRTAIDVAFLDAELKVVDVRVMTPWRLARPRRRCRAVLQAQLGAFERWGLQRGDTLELSECSDELR
jgi:uncharacterized membrane protein (UPF0127 family)